MARFIVLTLTLTTCILLILVGVARAQDDHGTANDDMAAARGAAVFAEFCQACHGPQGEAIGTGPAFAAITFDPATARDVIVNGHGEVMPPYGEVLADESIDAVVAYLQMWESGDVPPLPEPNIHEEPESVPGYPGNPHAGAVVYAKFCNGCHGAHGEGRGEAEFPAFEASNQMAAFVSAQHDPAFGEAAGGPLSDDQVRDLEAYLASWQAEIREEPPRSDGINVLIVVGGAAAIMVIGTTYLARTRSGRRA